MKTTFNGKGIEIKGKLEDWLEKKIAKLDKYLREAQEVNVKLVQQTKERSTCEITIPLDGSILRVEESTADMFTSIDKCVEKMVRMIRRHRTKLDKRLRQDAFEEKDVLDEPLFEDTDTTPVRVLQNTNYERRNLINQFLRYPDNSAGSIMTIEYCESHTGETVRQTMEEIKRTAIDKETVYTVYVIDDRRRLIGTVALRKLIMADDGEPIDRLMDTNVISVITTDDQETVADTVRKYDLMSIPVVDRENRLVGIITIDDIVDVIEEENTEDFEKMGALIPSEDEYLKTSVVRLFRNRIPWLLILMISATFTGLIITRYEVVLQASAIGTVIMACIPMLMDTGGNCGSQTSVLIIRGLALGELGFKDLPTILWKEMRVAVMVGAVLSIVNFLRLIAMSWLFDVNAMGQHAVSWQNAGAWGVVSISIFMTAVIAKSIGCILPLCAKKVHLDPALMASPLITTIVDASALAVLFTIASRTLSMV
ncbi:magnesium transporter [Eubacteriales bacterium OttesenSCG-928-N13]|nr:magnesium transporter [Eubacteriales bacterium OttesenSCG-928-N13]